MFLLVIEQRISMNLNCKNNFARQKLRLEFFTKPNVERSKPINFRFLHIWMSKEICIADPCKGVKCKNYGVCKANPSTPKGYKCACRECTTLVSPVCGSDKRTHKSECLLRRTSCRKDKYLFVAHKGPCGK